VAAISLPASGKPHQARGGSAWGMGGGAVLGSYCCIPPSNCTGIGGHGQPATGSRFCSSRADRGGTGWSQPLKSQAPNGFPIGSPWLSRQWGGLGLGMGCYPAAVLIPCLFCLSQEHWRHHLHPVSTLAVWLGGWPGGQISSGPGLCGVPDLLWCSVNA
jgi:hypothetical protein